MKYSSLFIDDFWTEQRQNIQKDNKNIIQSYRLSPIPFATSFMQFIICSKHNKSQKAAHKVTTNSYVCMNRYCQGSFLTLCNICKNDHRDHSNKILTLQDITFLIERLLKSPFKELTHYIDEAVNAMKKFKLIQENKRKIDVLQKQIYKEVIGLVDFTESLIHEYALCKKKITQLSDMLINVQTPDIFGQFTKNSTGFLCNLEYNFQKDKFEYGNQIIRQKYENRRKAYEKTKRRLEQVKDYSMKIIEVILANEDSEDEEEDIIYKKKMYEILKRELEESYSKTNNLQESMKNNNQVVLNIANKNSQKEYSTGTKAGIETRQKFQVQSNSNNNTRQTSQNGNSSVISQDKKTISEDKKTISQDKKTKTILSPILSTKLNPVLSIQKSCQTNSDWLKAIEQSNKQSELKIKRIQQSHAKALNQLQNKIAILVKQKQTIKKQYALLEQKQKIKNDKILEIQSKLRQNKKKRQKKEMQRQTKLQKLIDIANWKTIIQGDRID